MSTNSVPEAPTGFYECSTLSGADNKFLTPFFTTSWAGMSELLVDTPEGHVKYAYFADFFSGFASDPETNQPLRRIERALNQETQSSYLPLHTLSALVGQVADPVRGMKIQKWERSSIMEQRAKLGDVTLSDVRERWRKSDFKQYFEEIRAMEREDLLLQIADMAGNIAVYNETHQLYVARQSGIRSDHGWFAPLVGLSVDTIVENDFRHQVHDVVPVIRQTNGTPALLWGAESGIYTRYTPSPIGFGSA